jgi:hypothetical protein
MRKDYIRHLIRDCLFLTLSIFAAMWLSKIGAIEEFIDFTSPAPLAASFLAGMFFTSVFTIGPAAVAIVGLSQSVPALDLAFFGAIGATFVDLSMFAFLRDRVSKDARSFFKSSFRKRFVSFFHFGLIKWVVIGSGALVIASPFPDEAGLAILSLVKIKPYQLVLITASMNFLGILFLAKAAQFLM